MLVEYGKILYLKLYIDATHMEGRVEQTLRKQRGHSIRWTHDGTDNGAAQLMVLKGQAGLERT